MSVTVRRSHAAGPDGSVLAEWSSSVATPWAGRLLATDLGHALWTSDLGWFEIARDGSSMTVPPTLEVLRREERMWGIPAMLAFMARGDLPLHASSVEIEGEAVILAGPRTAGKTTIAAAFVDAGYRLLSEDVTCVRTGQRPTVIPGPAMLRVRRDVAAWLSIDHATPVDGGAMRSAAGGPGEPTDAGMDDRVHYALDPTTRGDCTPIPIRGVFLVRPGAAGVEVDPVKGTSAVRDLWSLSSRLPTAEGRADCFARLVDVVRAVPAWELRRSMDGYDLRPVLDRILSTT